MENGPPLSFRFSQIRPFCEKIGALPARQKPDIPVGGCLASVLSILMASFVYHKDAASYSFFLVGNGQ